MITVENVTKSEYKKLICVIIGYLSHYWGGGSKNNCLKEQNAEIKCKNKNYKKVIFFVLRDCQGGSCVFVD